MGLQIWTTKRITLEILKYYVYFFHSSLRYITYVQYIQEYLLWQFLAIQINLGVALLAHRVDNQAKDCWIMKLHRELNCPKLIGEIRELVKQMIHHIHKMYSPFSLLEVANFKSVNFTKSLIYVIVKWNQSSYSKNS